MFRRDMPSLYELLDRTTPEIAATIRAGERVLDLEHRAHHYQVFATATGAYVTLNGLGEEDDLWKHVRFDEARHADSFARRLLAEAIRDVAGEPNPWSLFRSWYDLPGRHVVVEHDTIRHHWSVVIGETVYLLTLDEEEIERADDTGTWKAFVDPCRGWEFVEQCLAAAGMTLRDVPRIDAAAIADRAGR